MKLSANTKATWGRDSPQRLYESSRAQDNYEQRLIDVEWEDNTTDYIAHIDIYDSTDGLLNDVPPSPFHTAKMIQLSMPNQIKDMKFANIHISFGDSGTYRCWTTVVDKIKSVPEKILLSVLTARSAAQLLFMSFSLARLAVLSAACVSPFLSEVDVL